LPDVVNLRAFRKAKARTEAEKRAEENRAKFGQTKAEKRARKAEEARAGKAHAAGRIEDAPAIPPRKPGSD
jgi:hypothetical protein